MIYWLCKDRRSSTKFGIPYQLNSTDIREHYPDLDQKYKLGVVYEDGQMDDSRFNLEIILSAAELGANTLNYTQFNEFLKDDKGNLNGVVAEDRISGEKYHVKGKSIINCTGIFADQIRSVGNKDCQERIELAGGAHLVFSNKFSSKHYSLLFPKTDDGRVVFVLNWLNHTLVGTTDYKEGEPTIHPKVRFADQLFLSKEMQKYFTKKTSSEIVTELRSKWSGIRPLIQENTDINTKSLTRGHTIEVAPNGLISIMGGKWTTARRIGEEALLTAVSELKS